jgi:hypothetical protein
VAVARGNEKGRVERAIRYVRDNFFAAREFTDLDDLNVQAETWCRGLAADRRCPGQDTLSVREAFAAEAPRLLALPDNPPLIERVAVKAGKTPYVRFDLNDYSIPHTKVQRLLTVGRSGGGSMSTPMRPPPADDARSPLPTIVVNGLTEQAPDVL